MTSVYDEGNTAGYRGQILPPGGIAASGNAIPHQIRRSLVDRNVHRLRTPHTRGRWSDTPGNSLWIPDDDAMYYVGGRRGRVAGAQLKQDYGFTAIAYQDDEPDFMPFADRTIGVIRLREVPGQRLGPAGSYALARQAALRSGRFPDEGAIRSWMKAHDLVWHECGDGHTVIAVPREINRAFPHTGAIGVARGMEKLRSRRSAGRPMNLRRGGINGRIVRIRTIRRGFM